MNYPKLTKNPDLLLEFRPTSPDERKIFDLPVILDINGMGNIIGIEIINFKFRTTPTVINGVSEILQQAKSQIRFSYDSETDALSIGILKDRSLDQRSVKGKVIVDFKGQLAAIFVPTTK